MLLYVCTYTLHSCVYLLGEGDYSHFRVISCSIRGRVIADRFSGPVPAGRVTYISLHLLLDQFTLGLFFLMFHSFSFIPTGIVVAAQSAAAVNERMATNDANRKLGED